MGPKSSKQKNTEIINSTDVRTALRKVNTRLNEIVLDITQKSLTDISASAITTQGVIVRNVNVDGNIIISDVNQDNQVKISLTSLTDSAIKQDMVSDIQDSLEAKIAQMLDMSQDQSKEDGEQALGGLIDAVASMSPFSGGKDEKTNLTMQNLMKIDSTVELISEIKNAISTTLLNETITNLATDLNAEQIVKVEDSTVGGSIIISNIDQRNFSSMMIDAISKSGITADTLAKLSAVDKTDMTNSLKTTVTQTHKEIGTIQSVGDAVATMVNSVGDAAGTIIGSVSGMAFLMIGVVIVIIIVMMMTMKGK